MRGQFAPARRFTSGCGSVRYDFPSIDGLRLERTDIVPDGRRGALLGLKLTHPERRARSVDVMVDVHFELMSQYPWSSTTPAAGANGPDTAARDGATAVIRDVGRMPGETADHSYTAIVGSGRRPTSVRFGPGHYGPFGAGRRCTGTETVAPMPSQCDDGPFGRGTGARLTYAVRVPATGSATVWIAVAGSDTSPAGRAARSIASSPRGRTRWRARPPHARRSAAGRASRCRATGASRTRSIGGSRTSRTSRRSPRTSTSAGRTRARSGRTRATSTASGGSARGSPTTRGCSATDAFYTSRAALALGQFEAIEDHLRALRDISDLVSDRSGVVVHEVVADGSVYFGKDLQTTDPATGAVQYAFNTDEIVRFPSAVARVWRWTGDDAFRDEMLGFARRNLDYALTHLDEDGDGWTEGNGNVERPGMGAEKLDNAVYVIRALYDYADMARSAGLAGRSAGLAGEADDAQARADALSPRFEDDWWIEADQQYADSLRDPGNVKVNQKHWIGAIPMEAELVRDGEYQPGVATRENGSRALATRENGCYSSERPGNRGLFHTGCGGGPTGAGEFAIFSLNTAIMAVGEGDFGRLGAEQQQRYTDANAETQFSEPASGGTPDEQPGAMPEIMPSNAPDGTVGTPPNIDRCWKCRSMFMQAWGHYGTAWPVIHQQLGVRPQLGHDWLEVVPQVPDGRPDAEGSDIRLGRGSADVFASHTGTRYATTVDASDVPGLTTLRVGHTLPAGATVAGVELDGHAAAGYRTRTTSRGVEVTVDADPGTRHTLVVTAGA